MFIRRTSTRRSGEHYFTFRLVRSERSGSKVRQRTLLNLGRHFDVAPCDWPSLCRRIDELLAGQLLSCRLLLLVRTICAIQDAGDKGGRPEGRRRQGGAPRRAPETRGGAPKGAGDKGAPEGHHVAKITPVSRKSTPPSRRAQREVPAADGTRPGGAGGHSCPPVPAPHLR